MRPGSELFYFPMARPPAQSDFSASGGPLSIIRYGERVQPRGKAAYRPSVSIRRGSVPDSLAFRYSL